MSKGKEKERKGKENESKKGRKRTNEVGRRGGEAIGIILPRRGKVIHLIVEDDSCR